MAGHKRGAVHRYADFNLDALLSLATRLRGRSCTCDVSKEPEFGCHNFVISLFFDDGIEWIFRAPQETSEAFSKEMCHKIIESEAATLKYLGAHSSIPVPEIYSYTYDEQA